MDECLRRKDGSSFPVEYWIRRVEPPVGVTILVVAIRDVTELQKAKEGLRESQEKFRRILARMPEVTWTADRQRRLSYVSPKIEAMLSQLGCVTLAPETIDAVYKGETLSENEQAQYDAHPGVASSLLSKIPRLEPIAWMIGHQDKAVSETEAAQVGEMRQGAEILRMILAYEKEIHSGVSRTEAAHTLSRQNRNFSPKFFEALVTLDPNAEESGVRRYQIDDLTPGMIIQQELRSVSGTLLVSKGQEVTAAVILKLKNFLSRRAIGNEVSVSLPPTSLAFVKGAS